MKCCLTATERSVKVPVILFSKVYKFCVTYRNISFLILETLCVLIRGLKNMDICMAFRILLLTAVALEVENLPTD